MTIEGLGFVDSLMEKLDIPYQFMEWTSDVPDIYWVGEYNEIEPLGEGGMEESNFILTGTTNKKYIELESVKQMIKEELGNGLTAILDSGSGIAVCYSNGFPIPSVDKGVHRIQITLRIKEWRITNE